MFAKGRTFEETIETPLDETFPGDRLGLFESGGCNAAGVFLFTTRNERSARMQSNIGERAFEVLIFMGEFSIAFQILTP
jgi:hypothetical protein